MHLWTEWQDRTRKYLPPGHGPPLFHDWDSIILPVRLDLGTVNEHIIV